VGWVVVKLLEAEFPPTKVWGLELTPILEEESIFLFSVKI
jgi:hypothetical protein